MLILPGRTGRTVIVMERDVEVVRVGPDPFGRGEPTVFYRDYRIDGGREVFYLWVEHWKNSYPTVPLPEPTDDPANLSGRKARVGGDQPVRHDERGRRRGRDPVVPRVRGGRRGPGG